MAQAEFGLLGPLIVRNGDAVAPVQPGKQRVVLAALLLSANHVVQVDQLTEALWGSAPPPSARVTLRNYVRRLRATLSQAELDRISTRPGGYLISVAPGELDVSRFEEFLRQARAEARDGAWDRAAEGARVALSLWRGEPLADVESAALTLRNVPRLLELRLQANELRMEAEIELGHYAEAISELRQHVAEHPLRERVHALLMLSLYRDGRQAEALAAYQQARTVLVEELGVEPGRELSQLHHQMLTGDPELEPAVQARRQQASAALPPPRQLPAPVAQFTGRQRELAALTALLGPASDKQPGPIVISAIGGTAGVGKTALAVHWAHLVADRFPDGQLYVNLRGYDQGEPVATADALAGFLRALGVPPQDIAATTQERAAQYRTLLAGRRMLLVLDNARSVDQVRPLLPGSQSCAAIITSRDALTGLVARDGASRIELDLLPLPDAIDLLRGLIGARVTADPVAAGALADRCSRLPLALRLAAELALARPGTGLAELAGELADQQHKLDLLDAGGDRSTAVRAVFSWSLRYLDPAQARAFRCLGLHPGPDFDAYAVAALTDSTLRAAEQALAGLARAHLVQTVAPGRYTMHDLLRSYAAELGAGEPEAEQRSALTRLFDYYLCTAGVAMDTLFPAERHWRPRLSASSTPVPRMKSQGEARAWLDTERSALVSAASYMAAHDWPELAITLAATLFRYLDVGGHYSQAAAIHRNAVEAATQTGDRAARARALSDLAAVDLRQGRYAVAVGYYQQTLALFREMGDGSAAARTLGNLGGTYFQLGRYQLAADHLQQALALFRELGTRAGEAHALSDLGLIDLRQGRYKDADDRLRQCLDIYRQIGEPTGEAHALATIGVVAKLLGRHREADSRLRKALALCRSAGDRSGEARVVAEIGLVELARQRHQAAAEHLDDALALCRRIGDRDGEAEVLNGLGESCHAVGEFGQAQAHHGLALELAGQVGDRYELARAHRGLARAARVTGDDHRAREHAQQALALYAELNTPEAAEVRDWLAADGAHA